MNSYLGPSFAALSDHLIQAEKSLCKDKNLTKVPSLEELTKAAKINRRKIKGYIGRESIFKQASPLAPTVKISPIPDYHKNPKKWTTYSLANVSNDDISDESNNKAAMSFLRQLKRSKQLEQRKKEFKKAKLMKFQEQMDVDYPENESEVDTKEFQNASSSNIKDIQCNDKSTFVFKKPEKQKKMNDEEKPHYVNGKLEMPEYVVGTKPLKKTKAKTEISVTKEKVQELKLNHLLCEGENDTED